MITNDKDFYNYLRDKGVFVTLQLEPVTWSTNELIVVFPRTHVSNVSCNAHTHKYIDEYRKECENIVDWLKCGNRVICITPVIKFGSLYMYENAKEQYLRLKTTNYHKQIIHTKDIGELINPCRLQIRYKGLEPIKFDVVSTKSIIDPKCKWINKYGQHKSQQQHYMNVINATRDKEERRKLRHIPMYTLFSQLYKKLCL